MTSFKLLRVLIDDVTLSNKAHSWCQDFLETEEWSSEVFDNYDCFYFTSPTICSMFIMMHGGKYIPPPRGYNE